jgi:hypothetical protein
MAAVGDLNQLDEHALENRFTLPLQQPGPNILLDPVKLKQPRFTLHL